MCIQTIKLKLQCLEIGGFSLIASEAPKQCPVTQSVSCMASSVDPKVAVVGGLGLLLLQPVMSLGFIWPEICF